MQTVELVTLVKDAVFIYPQQITDSGGTTVIETLNFDVDGDGNSDATNLQGRFLENDELTFTNEKPYVIYGFAAVGDGQTLTIDAGARVHFHSNSGLLVTNNASVHANGLPSLDAEVMENEIILEGHRLEPGFSEVPGQWETIWLYSGSTDNKFNHTTIKNSKVGILTDGNQDDLSKLLITNTQIYNASLYGILGRATNIKAENLVINKTSFNGDDPIGLFKNGVLIDILGTLGDGSDYAKNITLVRNADVAAGSSIFNINEWTIYDDTNTCEDLGSHTQTLGVSQIANDAIKLYPNPLTGNTLFIDVLEKVDLEIYNLTGKKIFNYSLNPGTNPLPIGSLNSGIYIVQLHTIKKSWTRKIIKQ